MAHERCISAPKYIRDKARRLNSELELVAKLSGSIEEWVAKRAGDDVAADFFHEQHLDNPYEFNLAEALEALDEIANS